MRGIVAEWVKGSAVAGALRITDRAVRFRSKREGWLSRTAAGRGGGREYQVASLPEEVRARVLVHLGAAPAASMPANDDPARSEALWDAYDRKPTKLKKIAERRLRVLQSVEMLIGQGHARLKAISTVGELENESPATIRRWFGLVSGVGRGDWLPVLAPRWTGRTRTADCDVEAWDFFRSEYLRLERPCAAACYDRLMRVARERGWAVPSLRTLQRRIEREIPQPVITLARQGREAALRMYPAQERDRSVFKALEAVNADGHKFDVFVRWEDGEISRPIMLAVQDLYSGKILGYRLGKTESADLVRLAFRDVIERWGIPDKVWLDNGRGFASKKITGGTPNRFRFKVLPEEPAGILTQLQVEIHWAQPYHGQAKPIERAFRDLCEYVAKHPAFAGAYTGNRPDAKPENYGSAAVPVARFRQVLAEEISHHNARQGRRTAVCAGRSFDEAFAASYATAMVRRATEAQLRLLMLGAEGVTASREDGSIRLMGNRYWAPSPSLARLAGRKVVVRFDPDDLSQPVHVYQLDGTFVVTAEMVERAGFDNVQQAGEHARARRQWAKAQRAALDAERRMSAAEVAAALPAPEEPETPAPTVVRPMFGVAGATALAAQPAEREFTREEFEELFSAGLKRLKPR